MFSPLIVSKVLIALLETLNLLLISSLISIPIGFIFGLIITLNKKGNIFIKILSGFISIIRSIPFILIMILITPISYYLFKTSIGYLPSIISLSIIGISTFTRLVEQTLIDLNPFIYDLAYILNATKIKLVTNFILVEARSSLILAITNTLVSLLAYSTVLYIIGGGGLGYTAIQVGYYSPVGKNIMWLSVIVMILLVQVIQITGNLLAKKLNKKEVTQ
ncbi:MAG: ABC transporter permease subunit [Acholeplasmataceae bacterium]